MKEAMFWEKAGKENSVKCGLCPRNCEIPEGKKGFCRVRENQAGRLVSLVYGRPCSIAEDPIEKKPLFHFAPGSHCLSVATVGCNLACKFCFGPETAIATDTGIFTIRELFGIGRNDIIKQNYGTIRFIEGVKAVTCKGGMENIIKVFEHPYNGNILRIKPRYIPEIRCTPGHKFFVSRGLESGRVEKIRAADLKVGDFLVIPKNRVDGQKSVLDIKELLCSAKIGVTKKHNRKLTRDKLEKMMVMSDSGKYSREIGEAVGFHPVHVRRIICKARCNSKDFLFNKDTKIVEKNGRVKLSTERGLGLPRYINVDGRLGKLLGYYCAEGHSTKPNNRPNSNSVVFSFAKHERSYINETKKLLSEIFGIEARVVTRRTTETVEVKKSSFGILLGLLCGHNAKNKNVPSIMFRAKNGVIKEFLNAYICGDGWVGKDVVSINTVSKKLALGVYGLFLKLNLLPSFYVWRPKPEKLIENRKVKQSTLYYVKLQSKMHRRFLSMNHISYTEPKIERRVFYENVDFFFVPINRISDEKYSGHVYNIEMNNEHSYLANFVAVGNCQNWEISQLKGKPVYGEEALPEDIIALAQEKGLPGIAYTYTEPTVFFEYALDCMKLARKAGLYNVWVSNGYTSPGPARMAAKLMDAINVDLKGPPDFYSSICGVPDNSPIFESLKIYREAGVHIEVTTLLIPNRNDKPGQVRPLVEWVKKNLGRETPYHFSAYYPSHRMKELPTPVETVEKTAEIAKKAGLENVYLGNV
jgi:pyruvate-formate lyase-activating enzyme/intein/homing endonuclease